MSGWASRASWLRHISWHAWIWLSFSAAVAVFSQWPSFAPIAPDHGELKLSMSRLTERSEPCVQLTYEELMSLPPNMRQPERCVRERSMAALLVHANGRELLRTEIRPAGLHRDGRAYLFASWHLPAGDYTLHLQLNDGPGDEHHHEHTLPLTLSPGSSALLRVGDSGVQLVAPSKRQADGATR
jgi:hypothetical protein